MNKTFLFSYDKGGNIIERIEYAYSTLPADKLTDGVRFDYDYPVSGWKDQLMSYDGESFEYDSLGNPTTYRDKTLTWKYGRQLASFDTASYNYNADGIRISKTHNNETTHFYLDGTKILAQDNGNLLTFKYGVDGVIGFTYNGVGEYFYKKNIFGDIIGIFDSNGQEIVKYVYDAWGNHKTYVLNDGGYVDISENLSYTNDGSNNKFIAELNPFRYRGYYYDIETGLYYLNSRYYDPEIGRFINADDIAILDTTKEFINGLNLYTYCFNTPTNERDDSGKLIFSLFAIIIGAAIAGAIIGAGSVLVSDIINYSNTGSWQWSSWQKYVGAVFGGAVGGIISIWNPTLGIAIGSGLESLTSGLLEMYIGDNKSNITRSTIISSTLTSIAIGLVFGKLTQTLPIKGLTKGSHSIQQVAKGLITKTLNNSITNISLKSFSKIITYQIISEFNLGWILETLFNSFISN